MNIQKATLTCLVLFFSLAGSAQKGLNQIIPSLEVGVPVGDFKDYNVGLGFSLKGLFGVGEHAQIGVTTGYTSFVLSGATDAYKQKLSVIPILLTGRYHFPIIYLEPQIGYGIYGSTIKSEANGTETKISSSNGGFTWAIGGGVQVGNIDLGLRLQGGNPGGGSMSFVGIRAGYVFSSKN